MLDLIRSTIEASRTPERTEVMMDLVSELMECGYGDELHSVFDIISIADTDQTATIELERVICRHTSALLMRMGIEVTTEVVWERPRDCCAIISTIFNDVESFDDYDTMLQIVQHEDAPTVAIGELVGFVHNIQPGRIIEIIENVEPRTIRALLAVLNSRVAVADSERSVMDLEIALQMSQFIKQYPDYAICGLLRNYGYLRDTNALINDLTIGSDTNQVQEFSVAVAGIIYSKHTNYDDAYEAIEPLTAPVFNNDSVESEVNLTASNILTELYNNKGVVDE